MVVGTRNAMRDGMSAIRFKSLLHTASHSKVISHLLLALISPITLRTYLDITCPVLPRLIKGNNGGSSVQAAHQPAAREQVQV